MDGAEIFYIIKKPLLLTILGLIGIVILIPIITYVFFASDLKDKESIMNRNNGGITLLDRHGNEFFTFFAPKQKAFIPLSDIPQHMQEAVISSEDKEFYQHNGFSLKGIGRAILADIRHEEFVYGGSTITQQLVKNALLSQEKTIYRKYQELVLSYELERRFSKKDILEMYLNSVYFGEGAFGVENASEIYFGKHAKELTLGESALLVGLLPAPSALSPISNGPERAKLQQHIILDGMHKDGKITDREQTLAENQELSYQPKAEKKDNVIAPHFALFVKDWLSKKYGEEYITRSGFKVTTTLDLDWQRYAQQAVRNQLTYLQYNKVSNAAAVALNPKTGEILTYVGSYDWADDKFGKVDMVQSPRQPGSSFKPIVYETAFENRLITPATILQDELTTFDNNYTPLDFDKRFRGNVTVRRALANSLNIPAVEVMQKVGIDKVLAVAPQIGITTLKSSSDYGLSLVLGSGEVPLLQMTGAYATFANAGVYIEPTTILEIKDKNNNVIYTNNPQLRQVLDPNAAFLISSILSDNNARAEEFGNALTIRRPAAVKTGTSEEFRNALTIGYTPSLAVGVWLGNNDNTPMDNIAGALGPAPIWRNLMERFLANTPVEQFQAPSGINAVLICPDKGLKIREGSGAGFQEYFLSGTQPSDYCTDPTNPPTSTPTPTNTPTPTLTYTPTPTFPPTSTPLPTPTDIPTQPIISIPPIKNNL